MLHHNDSKNSYRLTTGISTAEKFTSDSVSIIGFHCSVWTTTVFNNFNGTTLGEKSLQKMACFSFFIAWWKTKTKCRTIVSGSTETVWCIALNLFMSRSVQSSNRFPLIRFCIYSQYKIKKNMMLPKWGKYVIALTEHKYILKNYIASMSSQIIPKFHKLSGKLARYFGS